MEVGSWNILLIEGGSDYDTSNIGDCEPFNLDDIKAWVLANEHSFSSLRLTTIGAAQSVLLQIEPKMVNLPTEKKAWLALQRKCQNSSRQLRRTMLRHLDHTIMKAETDPNIFSA